MIQLKNSHHDLYEVSCDFCNGSSQIIETDDFQTAVDEIKSLGWRIQKHGFKWEHMCPDCLKSFEDDDSYGNLWKDGE